ncbi:MAG: hypothetical protein ACREP9_00630, partial [Candidatus Dormibacteraceae bacterium]
MRVNTLLGRLQLVVNVDAGQTDKSRVGLDREHSATLWQLEVLAAVVELEDWGLVEQRLGVSRYRCRRALDRLAERLGVEKLVSRMDDRLIISPRDRSLAEKAKKVLSAYQELSETSGVSERSVILRFAAYPAHLKRFAARALGDLERSMSNVQVELQDLEGRRRRGGGVTSATQLRERAVDMVIATSNFDEAVPNGLVAKDLYGWRLMAVSSTENSIAHSSSRRVCQILSVNELRGRRLLVAPKGHRSRDLLDLFANLDPPWEVVGESEDPEVLSSL